MENVVQRLCPVMGFMPRAALRFRPRLKLTCDQVGLVIPFLVLLSSFCALSPSPKALLLKKPPEESIPTPSPNPNPAPDSCSF